MLGELVQTTRGEWITHPPTRCPNDHPFGSNRVLVGHQACLGHGGGHTTWTCRQCDETVFGPPMNTHCTALDGPPAYATHSEPSPQQIRESVIGNLGWRTGAALRQQRKRPSGAGESEGSPGLGGWRLPPHIRKAHWHRVRIVERDENSHAIGSREGIEGVDWHYELRWYPPTPVNADGGVAPTVRNP